MAMFRDPLTARVDDPQAPGAAEAPDSDLQSVECVHSQGAFGRHLQNVQDISPSRGDGSTNGYRMGDVMIKLGLALLLAATSTSAAAATLSEAHEAYDRNQVAEAERLYGEVVRDRSATADDRAEANVELARIAWLIDGKAGLALERLVAARAAGSKPCDVSEMISRVLREAGRSTEAIAAEPGLIESCTDPVKRDLIRINAIGALLDRASDVPAERNRQLIEATAQVRLLTAEAGVEGARVRLQTALLTNDAPAALTAWKDYFWLDETDAPQALEPLGATARFMRGLGAGASPADRLALAELLMRAGFAQESERFALAAGLPGAAGSDPVWRKLTTYWTERRKLQSAILKLNRALARGARKDSFSLDQPAKEAIGALMAASGASGDPREALLRDYGIVGTVGTTSGYPSIHMGHLIENRDDTVTQYGRSAKIRFQAIDNMIANGFESWLWDGSAMAGGWTADGVIVHVRPGYVASPLRAWRLTADSSDRREVIARQAKRVAEDIAKLKQRPIATLDGLNDRLQMQTVDQILAGARSRAASDGDVRRLFLAEYSKANLNQSIRVHEGRHAIDEVLGLSGKVDQSVLEYNAKLSELALTAYPRMALRNFNRNLEGDGPHDRGGARVFEGYRKWMEAHTDQVIGYDPNVPVLEQLDKLTDGQIRDIAHSLDPLAAGQ